MSKPISKSQPSILLVEDSTSLRRKLTRRLRETFPDARVGSARSKNEAINKFKKNPFDVLVIDIKLKHDTVPSGLDIVRELKSTTDHPFRSIAFSGFSKEYGYPAWKVGFDFFVEKGTESNIEELLAAIRNQIEILEKHPTTPKGNVFCSMPFDEEFLNVYLFGIKGAAQDAGLSCERNDDKIFTTEIVKEVKKNIEEANIVVADLTGSNANVYHEVGYADALRKEVVLIAKSKEDLKFNLQGRPCIIYGGHIHKLRNQLKDTLLKLGNKLSGKP